MRLLLFCLKYHCWHCEEKWEKNTLDINGKQDLLRLSLNFLVTKDSINSIRTERVVFHYPQRLLSSHTTGFPNFYIL